MSTQQSIHTDFSNRYHDALNQLHQMVHALDRGPSHGSVLNSALNSTTTSKSDIQEAVALFERGQAARQICFEKLDSMLQIVDSIQNGSMENFNSYETELSFGSIFEQLQSLELAFDELPDTYIEEAVNIFSQVQSLVNMGLAQLEVLTQRQSQLQSHPTSNPSPTEEDVPNV